MLGFAISFLTLACVARPDFLLLFFCAMYSSWHRASSNAVRSCTVARRGQEPHSCASSSVPGYCAASSIRDFRMPLCQFEQTAEEAGAGGHKSNLGGELGIAQSSARSPAIIEICSPLP
jgi:hypothetical protein